MKCFAVARMGFDDQKIVAGTLEEFLKIDMGEPLHSFVICAPELHFMEQEMYDFFHCSNQKDIKQVEPKKIDEPQEDN